MRGRTPAFRAPRPPPLALSTAAASWTPPWVDKGTPRTPLAQPWAPQIPSSSPRVLPLVTPSASAAAPSLPSRPPATPRSRPGLSRRSAIVLRVDLQPTGPTRGALHATPASGFPFYPAAVIAGVDLLASSTSPSSPSSTRVTPR